MKKIFLLGIFVLIVTPLMALADNTASKRMRGRIVLQVESRGEAWYVRSDKAERIYLGNPASAFNIMRTIGVGINNINIEKIPIFLDDVISGIDADNDGLSNDLEDAIGTDPQKADSDGDGYADGNEIKNNYSPFGPGKIPIDLVFSRKHAGKIFVATERHGEAWYVNPSNAKRYFLGRPADAFAVMRRVGVGITNNDLNTIKESGMYDEQRQESTEPSNPEVTAPSKPETVITFPVLPSAKMVDPSRPLLCNASAEAFKKSGQITCGHIEWKLIPETAAMFTGDPRPYLMEYDDFYLYLKDYMAGHEPNGKKITIQEIPTNDWPADSDWQRSVIHTNTPFARDQFVFIANTGVQALAPSFMHEVGHIFGLSSSVRNAYIWKDFVEADANLVGIVPYMMAYDGSFQLMVDFWCRNNLARDWPCDGYFTNFEDYPQWLGANDDLKKYEQRHETFDTLFVTPPADQNVYERGGKFQTMLTTLYSDWKKAHGSGAQFFQAFKNSQQFYIKNADAFPQSWLQDTALESRGQTLGKVNFYIYLLSVYLQTDLSPQFETWRIPILSETKAAIAKSIASGVTTADQIAFLKTISGQDGVPDGAGFTASYFGNTSLQGSPIVTRIDTKINMVWDGASPMPGVDGNNFSARWEGTIIPSADDEYTFTTIADDGTRLWVNGTLLIDDWTVHGMTPKQGKIFLKAGVPAWVKLEYFQGIFGAGIKFLWSSDRQLEQFVQGSPISTN